MCPRIFIFFRVHSRNPWHPRSIFYILILWLVGHYSFCCCYKMCDFLLYLDLIVKMIESPHLVSMLFWHVMGVHNEIEDTSELIFLFRLCFWGEKVAFLRDSLQNLQFCLMCKFGFATQYMSWKFGLERYIHLTSTLAKIRILGTESCPS